MTDKILSRLQIDVIKTKYFVEYVSFYLEHIAKKLKLVKGKKPSKSEYVLEIKKGSDKPSLSVTLISKYLQICVFPSTYNLKDKSKFMLISCKSITPNGKDKLGFNNLISLPTFIKDEKLFLKRVSLLHNEYKLNKIQDKYFLSEKDLKNLRGKNSKSFTKELKILEKYLLKTLPYYCKYYMNHVHSHFNRNFAKLKDIYIDNVKATKEIDKPLPVTKLSFKELAKKFKSKIEKELGIYVFYDNKNQLLYSTFSPTSSMIYVYELNKEDRKKFLKLYGSKKENASDFLQSKYKLINIILVKK